MVTYRFHTGSLGLIAPAELELIQTKAHVSWSLYNASKVAWGRVHSSRQPPNNPIARSEPELPLRRHFTGALTDWSRSSRISDSRTGHGSDRLPETSPITTPDHGVARPLSVILPLPLTIRVT
jgi:hypothetical protein